MTDSKALATAWLCALRARGVTVSLRNNRVALHPRNAHASLTDDEVLTLRHHRAAIKELVVAGGWEVTAPVSAQAAAPAPPATSAAELAAARDAALKARDLAAWRAIHFNDADEIERCQREATDLMLNRIGKSSPWT